MATIFKVISKKWNTKNRIIFSDSIVWSFICQIKVVSSGQSKNIKFKQFEIWKFRKKRLKRPSINFKSWNKKYCFKNFDCGFSNTAKSSSKLVDFIEKFEKLV